MEIQQYLKTGSEFDYGKQVIQRNTEYSVGSHLCLFVLKSLANGKQFQTILCSIMVDIHKVMGNIPFKPKRGFVLPKHRFTGLFNP